MDDLIKLLDRSIDDVKAGLPGKSHDDLLKLKVAEDGGKTRKGVLDALDAALAASDGERAGGVVQMAATHSTVAADFDASGPADIAPADTIDTAGAPQQIVPDVNLDHPAVDNDPRAGTTEHMNKIDFNDPVKPGVEVVEQALKDQAAA